MGFRLKILLGAALAVAVIVGCIFLVLSSTPKQEVVPAPVTEAVPEEPLPVVQVNTRTIGTSVEGRPIEAYSYGRGDTNLLFVGGIHGGYEWNSVLLAYNFIDYFTENPDLVPEGITVTIVPSANPDGLFAVTGLEGRFVALDATKNSADTPVGHGRFNANGVDLNRNFACKWKPESTWRGNIVSAGTAAFSEPEAQAIRSLVASSTPMAVVFWHSQSNAVYASECENGVLPKTRTIMNAYAQAAEYPAVDSFDAYDITGDAEGWLASIGIPAITVELKTHETIEWDRNLKGVQALLNLYSL